MSSDDNMRSSVTAFAPMGMGHHSGWQCAICMGRKTLTLGRRKLRVRGGKQWVCAGCVRTKDAQVVAA
jgi:hypothetical protein